MGPLTGTAVVTPLPLTDRGVERAGTLVRRALRVQAAGIVAAAGTVRPVQLRAEPARSALEVTVRERAVLVLAAEGCSNSDVAAELGISPLTVKRHMSRLMGRADVPSRTALVSLALRCGLLDGGEHANDAPC